MIEQRLTAGVGVGAFQVGLGAVLDAVADGITVQAADGRIVYANAAAAELIGFPDAATLIAAAPRQIVGRFELLAEDGTPLPLTALPGRRALTGEHPPPVTVRFRIPATGEERWSIVRASPLLDPSGAPTHAINAFQDITARILAEREARDAALRSRQLVESLPVIAWVADAHGRIEAVNARWWQYAGTEAAGDARDGGGGGPDGLPIDLTSLVHVDDRPRLAEAWEHALAMGEPLDETVRLVRADGASRWHVVRGVPAYDGAGAIGGWIGTWTDIDEAKRAADRSRLVAAASERLDESLDPDGTVRAAGAIAVPDLADVCVIDLLAEDGTTTRAAIVVGDPRYQATADELMDYPSIPGSGGLMGTVFASGRSTLVEDVTDDILLARTKDRRHADILRDLGIRSAIAVPLAARGQVLGAMALIHGWSGRRYRTDDVPLVEELARRVGLALANARLYVAEQDARRAAEHERDRIQRLQRLAGQLAETSSVAAVAALVLAEARTALDATAGSIYELEGDGDALAVVVADGYGPDVVDEFRRIPLASDAPLATAARTGEALWLPDLGVVRAGSPKLARALRRATHRAAVAIPLRAEGRVLGALGLSFPQVRTFSAADQGFVLALAELAAQGIARAILGAARAELMLALDAQRARLEAVVEQAPVGVVIADAATGRLLLGNAEVDRIYGRPFEPADGEDPGPPAFVPQDGRELAPDETPLARAMRGEVVEAEELGIVRADGSRATLLAWAAPIRAADGTIGSAVVALTDITERRMGQENQRFLAEAGELLGSSLDYEETLRRVASLAVPRIADWASVELVDDAGDLVQLAVAHVDPAKVELARRLRERYPPRSRQPAGRVCRSAHRSLGARDGPSDRGRPRKPARGRRAAGDPR